MIFLHQKKTYEALDDLVEHLVGHLEQTNACLERISTLINKGNQNQQEEAQTDDNQS